MPDSRVYTILETMRRRVEGDFTLKSSGIDMTGRAVLGSVIDPPYVPFASVHFIDFTTQHGPTMGRYSMVPRFEIYLFVGGPTLSERMRAAINLSSDVIENLTANRFLGLDAGTIDDTLCEFTAVDGDKYGLEGVGIGYIEVTTPFQSSTGI